jgi:secreted PhoX family phosphatase
MEEVDHIMRFHASRTSLAAVAVPVAVAVGVAVLGGAALLGGVAAEARAGGPQRGHQFFDALHDFGVIRGIDASSTQDIDAATATANPLALFTLAKGLRAKVVTAGKAAPTLDMAALWPVEHPTHLITCNEQGPTAAGVQRISLATGVAETIVTGTTACDPLHVTPWGTVIFGEEASDGHVYELTDPLATTNATLDRITGVASTPNIVRRDALGAVAFEGIAILPNGVTYYGDELAPGNGGPGGSFYKFVPATPWAGGQLTSLADSPFAAGSISVLKVGQGSNTGQGMASGIGTWAPVTPAATTGSLRPGALAARATGFYRPEDISLDERRLASGEVRFCGNNTGREQARYYGEAVCVTDGTIATATAGTAVPEVQLLVAGSPALNMPDNIAFQPRRGNWIIHEDGETTEPVAHNNDLWSCLDDGDDDDLQSDGCLRIGTLNDLTAEWTGGFFDASGRHFYVSIQHNKTGFGVIIDITGWR